MLFICAKLRHLFLSGRGREGLRMEHGKLKSRSLGAALSNKSVV
jgi:hypothetical protein